MNSSFFSKCLPLLFLPLGAAVVMLLAALRWRSKALVAAPLLLLWLFGVPAISDVLMRSLEDRYPQRSNDKCPKADAVFIFGGMLSLRGQVGGSIEWNEASERFYRAVDIYRAGKADVLVFSGGPESYEGQLLKTKAISMGVPEGAIIVTHETDNTEQEAGAISQLAVLNRWKRVLVITSAYHMPRAMRLSKYCLAELIPVPVAYETPDSGTSWPYKRPEYFVPQAHTLSISERALREYMGMFFCAERQVVIH